MLRALLRVIFVVIIVVAIAAFFIGYRWGGGHTQTETIEPTARQASPIGTIGTRTDTRNDTARERARAAGAEIGDKVATGAQKAGETLEEASLTAKVKSKIALDDTLDGSHIQVTSDNGRVSLTGTALNEAQHRRALDLARETAGVSAVVDHVSVGSR